MSWTSQECQRTPHLIAAAGEVEMTELTREYYWVVLCRNHRFHNRQNRSSGHKILLGETDSFLSRPPLDQSFVVRCDDCGKEYTRIYFLHKHVPLCECSLVERS